MKTELNYFILDKQPMPFWERVGSLIKVPFSLPGWLISFLIARSIVNIALNPTEVKQQKPIHPLYLSSNSDGQATFIVNLLPHETYKTLKDYLLKFNSAIMRLPFISGIKKRQLHYNNVNDKAYIDKVIAEIAPLIKAGDCEGQTFDWSRIHFKGSECLDSELYTYFISTLTKSYGSGVTEHERKTKLNFFTLQTPDDAVLDSVEVSTANEAAKKMSERKFVIACLSRDQNYMSWIRDFNYSAENIGCTVIGFNYRGIDYSKGMVWTQENLIADALAQVERLIALGAKPENIGLEGMCLGGAVATLVAARLHERDIKVHLYNERSFRSIPRLIAGYILPAASSSQWNPLNWLRYLASGIAYVFTSPVLWFAGWYIDAASAWDKIPEAYKNYSVIRSPNDANTELFKEDGNIHDSCASLASFIDEKKAMIDRKIDHGEQLTQEEKELAADNAKDHHFNINPKEESHLQGADPHVWPRRHLIQVGKQTPLHMHQHMVASFTKTFSSSSTTLQTTPGTYYYNPHSHVKIWLSKKRSVFMNTENQGRLIEMREQNPNDLIHLIYDSSLLDEKAHAELVVFCNENNITAVDADDDSFKQQLHTSNEQTLYDFYKDEIEHLDEGGNVAVASDILRWLRPSYTLGTYTDLDVALDTSALPETITVDAPLLLNIGSLKLGQKEMVIALNEYIAVVDETAAKTQIEQVHAGLISKLGHYDTNYIEETERELGGDSFFYRTFLSYMKNRAEALYIEKSKLLHPNATTISSRELRAYLNTLMSDKDSYLNFNRQSADESRDAIIKRLRNDLQQQLGLVKWLFFRHESHEISKVLSQSDDDVLAYLMKKEHSLYLKSIVICTTGPIEIANSLFNGYVLSPKEINRKALLASFKRYELQTAFQSKNVIPMHENIFNMLQFLGADVGELNDSSWLEEGIKLQDIRQKKLAKQREDFAANLPSTLATLKRQIELHIQNLEANSHGFWGLFRVVRKQEKQSALKKVLSCFNSNLEFNIAEFRSILDSIRSNKDVVFSGQFSNRTQQLIGDLDKLCHKSLVYRLAKDKIISGIEVQHDQSAESVQNLPRDNNKKPSGGGFNHRFFANGIEATGICPWPNATTSPGI